MFLLTLSKVIKSMVNEKIMFSNDKYSLLPKNYFSKLKDKNIVNILIVIQKKIY